MSRTTIMTINVREKFAPFRLATEGQVTFLLDSNPATAIDKIKQSKASKIYIDERIANRLFRTNDYPRPDIELVACRNPKLEFIKELSSSIQKQEQTQQRPIWVDYEKIAVIDPTSPPVVGENTTIGSEALATERDEDNNIWRFPHIGRVKIGRNVWIGSNVNISRAVLSDDTIIEDNVTIDDHVHIAHNCIIGKNTHITAGAIFGGSVTTGTDCWFGLNCTINDHVKIGNNVLVGIGAVVTKDIRDYDIVAGVPAKSIKDKVTLSSEKRYHMVGY
jgi:acetyltransferase-like isoleucine patch superfamily enzyme